MTTSYREFVIRHKLDFKEHQEECVNWCLRKEKGYTPTINLSLGGGTTKTIVSPSLGGGTPKGGLIADEMGLGKTIQIISLIHANPLQNTLIVVPVALLSQWHDALKQFQSPSQHIIYYHGTNRTKKETIADIQSQQLLPNQHHQPIINHCIVLTTYGEISRLAHHQQPRQFASPLHTIKWSRAVYDEAHHLRNPDTNTHQAALQLSCPIKWLLTGTPIQNSRRDFFALCRVIDIPPSLYMGPKIDLPTLTRNYIIKRTKKQLKIQMPELKEHTIQVKWSNPQECELARQLHTRLGMHNKQLPFPLQKLQNPHTSNIRIPEFKSKLVGYLRTRQLCIHPGLLKNAFIEADDKIDEQRNDDTNDDILYTDTNTSNERTTEFINKATSASSKLEAIVKHISDAFKTQTLQEQTTEIRRKLVFCEFRKEMDYLQSALAAHSIFTGRIDGTTPKYVKESTIISPIIQVLLLQVRTCNEGLNLQQYSDVYIVTPQWNPSVEAQAICRAYRIGQTRTVNVYRFIMEHSPLDLEDNMETVVIKCQQLKQEESRIISIVK